ncbi:MAG TPA: hypothetical protein VIL20_07850 [Sandaracinaceae bacterium]
MREHPRLATTLLTLTLTLVGPGASRAALLAYEGFDYEPTDQPFVADGGYGFEEPWSLFYSNHEIAAGSLVFGSLRTSGNRLRVYDSGFQVSLIRLVDSSIGDDGTTRYVSFLVRPEDEIHPYGWFGLVFGFTPLFVGKPGNGNPHYVVESLGGQSQVSTGVPAVLGETALVVVRIDFGPGPDTVTVYVNPEPGAPEPATGVVKSDVDLMTFWALEIYSSGAFSIDELRVGETFEDVTPKQRLAHEDFAYAPGAPLLDAAGGRGFVGAWVAGGTNAFVQDNYVISGDSLVFPGLATSGGRVQSPAVGAIAGLTRELEQSLGEDGTTCYVSFLVRPEETVGDGAFGGFFGLVLERPTEPELFVGKGGGSSLYALENRGGSSIVSTGIEATAGVTHLLVLKIESFDGADTITLYVDPVPGEPEPATGIVKNDIDLSGTTALTLYSSGAFSLDEIRVGDTFASVTPVPEPSSAHATALVALLLLAGARRGAVRRLGFH